MAERKVEPFQEGKVDRGGRNDQPAPPRPNFTPAPLGIPFDGRVPIVIVTRR